MAMVCVMKPMLEILSVLAPSGTLKLKRPLGSVKAPTLGNSTQETEAATTGSLSSEAMTTPVTVVCFF